MKVPPVTAAYARIERAGREGDGVVILGSIRLAWCLKLHHDIHEVEA